MNLSPRNTTSNKEGSASIKVNNNFTVCFQFYCFSALFQLLVLQQLFPTIMHSKCTIFQLIYGLNRLLWAGLGTYPFNNIVSVRYQV